MSWATPTTTGKRKKACVSKNSAGPSFTLPIDEHDRIEAMGALHDALIEDARNVAGYWHEVEGLSGDALDRAMCAYLDELMHLVVPAFDLGFNLWKAINESPVEP